VELYVHPHIRLHGVQSDRLPLPLPSCVPVTWRRVQRQIKGRGCLKLLGCATETAGVCHWSCWHRHRLGSSETPLWEPKMPQIKWYWWAAGYVPAYCSAPREKLLCCQVCMSTCPHYFGHSSIQPLQLHALGHLLIVVAKRVMCNGYTGCPRRNGQNFGRVFLMLNYTDITKNNYIQSW